MQRLAAAPVLPLAVAGVRPAVGVRPVAADGPGVAVAAAVAVEPHPSSTLQEKNPMKHTYCTTYLATAGALLVSLAASAATEAPGAAAPPADQTAAPGQPHYATPDEAIQALLDAAAHPGEGAIAKVLGPEAADLGSGDPVADGNALEDFLESAAEAVNIEQEAGVEDLAVVTMGADDWPFPIPLVRDAQGWYFDSATGKEEIYNRRIGRNELSTIETLRAYVQAQDEYAREDRNGDGVMEYARRLMSTPGTRDGLYWSSAEGEPESPMGHLVAEAVAEGYKTGQGGGARPYHGYLYRALTAQGHNAPDGTKDYLADGHLTGGFAALAYPAEYGNSGVLSFLVNQSGIVYENDLGPETAAAAAAITAYDPGEGWTAVTD
jgi:hypothetical protein